MSSSTDPLDSAVRAKVKATIGKSLPAELTDLVEAKLAQSFATGTSYKSAFRTLTSLLKPKAAEVLQADASVAAPVIASGKGLPASDFEQVAADLQSKKLSVGKLINRVQELEKAKRGLLHEASASAAAAAPLAQQQLDTEWARAQKARVVGLITQRIRAAKDAAATGGLENPQPWSDIGDGSMELFYQHAPNTAYLNQALKVYARVEALSTEYVNAHPSIFLRRAAIHTIMEDFESAIDDLRTFASKKVVALPASALAASAAAAASPAAASYAPVAAPRIAALRAYVRTVANLVAKKYHTAEGTLRQYVREMPNPSREQLRRDMVVLGLLGEGQNEGKGFVARVLGKVDQTSLRALQRNTNLDGTPLPLASVHESLETEFETPTSYVILDADGRTACLSLYNVMGDATKQKPIKQGDLLVVLDPLVREVRLAVSDDDNADVVSFRSIQCQNPNFLFINLKSYAPEDIVPVPE